MDGDIWVESEEEKGSTFHFTAWVGRSQKLFEKKSVGVGVLEGKRVLVVDDNENNLNILIHILKRLKMKWKTLNKGNKVLGALEEGVKNNDKKTKNRYFFRRAWNSPKNTGVIG